MSDLSRNEDRRIHAHNRNGRAVLVRYDRAGKWYVEDLDLGRSKVTVDQAVRVARNWIDGGGAVIRDVPGGRAFERPGCRQRWPKQPVGANDLHEAHVAEARQLSEDVHSARANSRRDMGQSETSGCWCDDKRLATCNPSCRLHAERDRYREALERIAGPVDDPSLSPDGKIAAKALQREPATPERIAATAKRNFEQWRNGIPLATPSGKKK